MNAAQKNRAKTACPKCGGPLVVVKYASQNGRRRCPPCTKKHQAEYARGWRARNPKPLTPPKVEVPPTPAELAERAAHRKAQRKAQRARYAARYPERVRQASRENSRRNRQRWYERNPGKFREKSRRREKAVSRATPVWADREAIVAIYNEAAQMESASGVEHHVDHIVPICSPIVCGLHIHWNLRVVTGAENREKGNRHWPDMPKEGA